MKKKWLGILIGCLLIVLMVGIGCAMMIFDRKTINYEASNQILYNPLMGFAPNADYMEAVGENTLVYVDVTWREVESQQGVYQFDEIEESNHLDYWRAQGKNVVFRFVCDIPGTEAHMDIPDWLYEITKDGTFYDSSYGKGYSPDYNNETLIECHRQVIEALGRRYGMDSFFAYVELGSLGHWGEWHVNIEAGIKRIPEENVCREYVMPYLEAFPNAKLLMRRPFESVTEYGLGVYTDMAGVVEDTEEWLSWINDGGIYTETQTAQVLKACPDIWDRQPIGGEFSSLYTMDELLTGKLEQTLQLLEQTHMTFVGPNCPIANVELLDYPESVQEILRNVGYRIGVSQCKIVDNKLLNMSTVHLNIANSGIAPMYADWPMYLYVIGENGNVIEKQKLQISLADLKGKSSRWITAKLNCCILSEKYQLGVGIENPDTGNAEILLDMNVQKQEKVYMLK